MDHRVEGKAREKSVQTGRNEQIQDVQPPRGHVVRVTVREIVDDLHVVPEPQQVMRRVRSNVAGAASD